MLLPCAVVVAVVVKKIRHLRTFPAQNLGSGVLRKDYLG